MFGNSCARLLMKVDSSFAHSWRAEVLAARPLILPPCHFTYPQDVEDVERGALEVLVRTPFGAAFLATFALGFADPSVAGGIWGCPDPDQLCAVSGGYAYVVDTRDPGRFTHLAVRPSFEIQALVEHQLLLFVGSRELMAWGREGQAWQSPRLSAEGLRIAEIRGHELYGFGWDVMSDREIPFILDLHTGQRRGPQSSSAR